MRHSPLSWLLPGGSEGGSWPGWCGWDAKFSVLGWHCLRDLRFHPALLDVLLLCQWQVTMEEVWNKTFEFDLRKFDTESAYHMFFCLL